MDNNASSSYDTFILSEKFDKNILTLINELQYRTGVLYIKVPVTDEALKVFSSPKGLGLSGDGLTSNCKFNIIGFEERKIQSIAEVLKPDTFADYVRIFLFCFGTNVWENNQRELILSGKMNSNDLISSRDDVFHLLLNKGMAEAHAYKITEVIRKGKAECLFDVSIIKELRETGISVLQIQIFKKIRYLPLKARGIRFTILAAKISWYKLHYPKEFNKV